MEYLEGESRAWNLLQHTNIPTRTTSPHGPNFKPVRIHHPASCCLCAISEVQEDEQVISDETDDDKRDDRNGNEEENDLPSTSALDGNVSIGENESGLNECASFTDSVLIVSSNDSDDSNDSNDSSHSAPVTDDSSEKINIERDDDDSSDKVDERDDNGVSNHEELPLLPPSLPPPPPPPCGENWSSPSEEDEDEDKGGQEPLRPIDGIPDKEQSLMGEMKCNKQEQLTAEDGVVFSVSSPEIVADEEMDERNQERGNDDGSNLTTTTTLTTENQSMDEEKELVKDLRSSWDTSSEGNGDATAESEGNNGEANDYVEEIFISVETQENNEDGIDSSHVSTCPETKDKTRHNDETSLLVADDDNFEPKTNTEVPKEQNSSLTDTLNESNFIDMRNDVNRQTAIDKHNFLSSKQTFTESNDCIVNDAESSVGKMDESQSSVDENAPSENDEDEMQTKGSKEYECNIEEFGNRNVENSQVDDLLFHDETMKIGNIDGTHVICDKKLIRNDSQLSQNQIGESDFEIERDSFKEEAEQETEEVTEAEEETEAKAEVTEAEEETEVEEVTGAEVLTETEAKAETEEETEMEETKAEAEEKAETEETKAEAEGEIEAKEEEDTKTEAEEKAILSPSVDDILEENINRNNLISYGSKTIENERNLEGGETFCETEESDDDGDKSTLTQIIPVSEQISEGTNEKELSSCNDIETQVQAEITTDSTSDTSVKFDSEFQNTDFDSCSSSNNEARMNSEKGENIDSEEFSPIRSKSRSENIAKSCLRRPSFESDEIYDGNISLLREDSCTSDPKEFSSYEDMRKESWDAFHRGTEGIEDNDDVLIDYSLRTILVFSEGGIHAARLFHVEYSDDEDETSMVQGVPLLNSENERGINSEDVVPSVQFANNDFFVNASQENGGLRPPSDVTDTSRGKSADEGSGNVFTDTIVMPFDTSCSLPPDSDEIPENDKIEDENEQLFENFVLPFEEEHQMTERDTKKDCVESVDTLQLKEDKDHIPDGLSPLDAVCVDEEANSNENDAILESDHLVSEEIMYDKNKSSSETFYSGIEIEANVVAPDVGPNDIPANDESISSFGNASGLSSEEENEINTDDAEDENDLQNGTETVENKKIPFANQSEVDVCENEIRCEETDTKEEEEAEETEKAEEEETEKTEAEEIEKTEEEEAEGTNKAEGTERAEEEEGPEKAEEEETEKAEEEETEKAEEEEAEKAEEEETEKTEAEEIEKTEAEEIEKTEEEEAEGTNKAQEEAEGTEKAEEEEGPEKAEEETEKAEEEETEKAEEEETEKAEEEETEKTESEEIEKTEEEEAEGTNKAEETEKAEEEAEGTEKAEEEEETEKAEEEETEKAEEEETEKAEEEETEEEGRNKAEEEPKEIEKAEEETEETEDAQKTETEKENPEVMEILCNDSQTASNGSSHTIRDCVPLEPKEIYYVSGGDDDNDHQSDDGGLSTRNDYENETLLSAEKSDRTNANIINVIELLDANNEIGVEAREQQQTERITKRESEATHGNLVRISADSSDVTRLINIFRVNSFSSESSDNNRSNICSSTSSNSNSSSSGSYDAVDGLSEVIEIHSFTNHSSRVCDLVSLDSGNCDEEIGSSLVRSINILCDKESSDSVSEKEDSDHSETSSVRSFTVNDENDSRSNKEYESCNVESDLIIGEYDLISGENRDSVSFKSESFSDSPLPTITEEREDMSLTYVINSNVGEEELEAEEEEAKEEEAKEEEEEEEDFATLTESKSRTSQDYEIKGSNESNETEADEEESYTLKSNSKSEFQLVVESVIRDIDDSVFFMPDEQNDNINDLNDEIEDDESPSNSRNDAGDDIVMMNDDASFITVVNDVTPRNYNPEKDVIGDDEMMKQIVSLESQDNASDELSLRTSTESLPSSGEPTKQSCHHNDTLKRKLCRFERRLSDISLNFFNKLPTEERKEDPSPKVRRPLSGVRKRLANSRRKTLKARGHDPSKDDFHDSDSDASTITVHSEGEKEKAITPDKGAEENKIFPLQRKKKKIRHRRTCDDGNEDYSQSFGKRAQGGGRRPNECLILEPSEIMVINDPDVQLPYPGQRSSVTPRTTEKLHFALDPRDTSLRGAGGVGCPLNPSTGVPPEGAPFHYQTHLHLQQLHHDLPDLLRGGRSRGSVGSSVRDGSDTSSAYSGSDTMCQSIHSLDHDDVDLSGLMESVVDSDEEDLVENVESMSVQDTVRECLEKDPSDRTENDIKVLLEFTERLSAFANFTVGVRRAMCQAMVFAVVEEADTILMNDGEELDSWSVIINGSVEVTHPDGSVHKLNLGDSFGITPTMEKLYHRGVMRSKVDDCQFVCIRQSDYYRILRQGEENTRRHEEDGVLVLVTEKSHIDTCHREANIVIKGTPERLMLHLVEVENILDTTYVEDFLLTHRKFIKNSVIVAKKLLEWFEDPKYQDIVTRVFLRWVQSYFTDFEMDPEMMNCLEQFEEGLQRKEMTGQLFFLRMVCMTKARSRVVTLTSPNRDKPLQFTIVGRKNFGIFISSVERGSKAEEIGLKRADQILEANGQSFTNITRNEGLEILTSTCHLEMTVRSNLHTYNDMLQTPENAHKGKSRKTSDLTGNGTCQGHLDFVSTLNLNTALSPQLPHNRKEGKGTSMTLKTHKFKEFLASIVTKSSIIDDSVSSHSSTGGHLYRSRSNPDLSSTDYEESSKSEFPDHVLKVYRASDQSTRFLPVHKETAAREVVMLALSLFNMAEPSQKYALYEVSVTESSANEQNVVKQKRLPDTLSNLAERIGLSSRYYLKSVTSSQNLCPDEVVNELIRESQVNILQLNSVVELAIQLTLEDFAIFRQIEPTEYIDSLFKLKSKYGTPALSKFEEISNRELYWVCTEVCSEHNIHKRAKIIKQFIKIAKYCKDLNNFNSMFAILSGLGSSSVSRLRQTWARVSSRYKKIFNDLETVMDPSQNMKNYRKLASSSFSQSPMIPFYPIVKKDLLFLNEGNDDEVDGLINFEKLRTISNSIRKLGEMCSTKYCPNKMLEKLGQPQSTAMTAMNQGITGSQQSSTVKRRKKSTALPDKKKMFEEAQMVRRVKAYLSQLKVITEEETLMRMSYECEPPTSSHMSGSTHMAVGSASSSSSSSGQQITSGSNSAPPSNPQTRRRHHSPTPSTASSNSSNSHTSEGKKTHARFGAASPTSERKMLSLAETTKKPYYGPRPPTSATALTQTSLSPNPSPGALRRGPAPAIPVNAPGPPAVRSSHERSHSDTPVSSVDLNAESSSVTSLSSFANLRKSHTSGRPLDPLSPLCEGGTNWHSPLWHSVTHYQIHALQPSPASLSSSFSHSSSSMTSNDCHGSQAETDSGISTYFDCHSSSSLEGGGGGAPFEGHFTPSPSSPPPHHRRFSHQPVACGSRLLRRGVSGGPPDYTSTQMRIQQLGRASSHDGVPYYHHSRHEDEEDEAQVSAV